MKEITSEFLIKDNTLKRTRMVGLGSTIVGVLITVFPLIMSRTLDFNTIIGMLFCFVFFGSVFGWFFGLRLFLRANNAIQNIKNGKIKVVKDVVTGKQKIEKNDRTRTLVFFEDYTARCEKGIIMRHGMYNKIKKGDAFYLIYLGEDEKPLDAYPVSDYYLNGISCVNSWN